MSTPAAVRVPRSPVPCPIVQPFPNNPTVFPHLHDDAELARTTGEIRVTPRAEAGSPRYVVHVPIRAEWRERFPLDLFVERLHDVVRVVEDLDVETVGVSLYAQAMPEGLTIGHLIGMVRAAFADTATAIKVVSRADDVPPDVVLVA